MMVSVSVPGMLFYRISMIHSMATVFQLLYNARTYVSAAIKIYCLVQNFRSEFDKLVFKICNLIGKNPEQSCNIKCLLTKNIIENLLKFCNSHIHSVLGSIFKNRV